MQPLTTLTLGDFQFGRFEVPEDITYGGDQKTVVHQLIGGKRTIDAMGTAPDDITWSGWLVGNNAQARGRYLETMRDAGKAVKLAWSSQTFTVIVKAVRCKFLLPFRIQYTITCEVVSNDSAPVTSLPSPDAEQLVNDDLAKATTLAASVGSTGLTGALASVSTALSSVSNFATASLAQIKAVMQPIQTARGQITTLMSQTGTTLAQLGSLASLGGLVQNPVSRFVNGLALSTVAAQQHGTLAQIDAALGRMQQNIGAVNAAAKTVIVGSTNLFAVASQQYGDASQWNRLAQANGTTDPMVTGVTKLSIPPAPTSSNGGVLNA